jgi:ArsR family transcriptional regulator, nickel/cobalt-responsive transcriptional repressor
MISPRRAKHDERGSMNRQISVDQNSLRDKSAAEQAEIKRYSDCAQLMSAIADTNRLMIVTVLLKQSAGVAELAKLIECDTSTTSHHLGVLKTAGLVVAERDGKQQIHSLRPEFVIRSKGRAPNRLNFGCCTVALGK